MTFAGATDTGKKAEISGRVTNVREEREAQFSTNLGINEWSQIVATSSVSMNMMDYKIESSTALYGVIRTDEEIELMLELYFGRRNQN